MTNFNYARLSKTQQDACRAHSSDISQGSDVFIKVVSFGLIDRILKYISQHQRLCGFSLFFGLVRAFCHFTAKIYENWTPFQFKSELFMGRHVNFGVQSKPTNLTLNFLFRNRQILTMLAFVIYKLAGLTVPCPLYVQVSPHLLSSSNSPLQL